MPGPLTACIGQDVTFDWVLNDTLSDRVTGTLIIRKEPVREIILRWHKGSYIPNNRSDVKPIHKTGMKLLNVKAEQNGSYECTAYFMTGKQINHLTNLTITGGKQSESYPK